jgi:hypothetical protein
MEILIKFLKLSKFIFIATPIISTLIYTKSIMQGFPLLKLLACVIGLTCLLFLILLQNQIRVFMSNAIYLWPMVLFLAITILVALNSGQKFNIVFFGANGRYTGLIYTLVTGLYFIVTFYLTNSRDIIIITFKFTSMVGLGLSLVGNYNSIKYPNNFLSQQTEPYNLTFNNKNFSTFFLSLSAIITLYLFLMVKNNASKTFFIINFVCHFLAILRIGDSQGIIYLSLGIAMVLFFSLLYSSWIRKNIGLKFVYFGIFGFLVFVSIFGPKIILWILENRTFRYRLYLWKSGYQIFQDNWLFGVGLGSFGDWEPRYRDPQLNIELGLQPEEYSLDPHNSVIGALVNGGIPLFFSYFVLILFITYKGLLGFRKNKDIVLHGSLFSLWVIFVMKQLVSIDNLSVDLWGWIFAAFLLKLSYNEINIPIQTNFISKMTRNKNRVTNFTFYCTILVMSLSTVIIYNHVYQNFLIFDRLKLVAKNPNSSKSIEYVKQASLFSKNIPSTEIRIAFVEILIYSGQVEEAINVARYTIQDFPNRADGWKTLAIIYEDLGDKRQSEMFNLESKRLRPLDFKF